MGRSSSLNNFTDTAVTREIGSKYDNVKKVADVVTTIEKFTDDVITDVTTVADNLPDVQTVTAAQDIIANLDVVVSDTLPAGSNATATLVGSTIELQIPVGNTGEAGADGANGLNGATGPRGPEGDKGDTGSVGPRGYTGATGATGPKGDKGDSGDSIYLSGVTDNTDGTFTWRFSDGSAYTTSDLTGEQGAQGIQGIKGDQGVSVHHTKGTSTTDPEGDFSTAGETDTYTMYGDADETLVLGSFSITNGTAETSAAYIKARYESNANTNAYTDAAKAKVDLVTVTEAIDLDNAEVQANKNQPNGYPGLDGSGKIEAAQLPSYVDDVLEYADYASLPVTGETGKIYIVLDTNFSYRWSGSVYVDITSKVDSVAGKTGVVTLDMDDIATVSQIGSPDDIDTLTKLFNHMYSSGAMKGFTLTNNLDGTVDIATGQAYLRAVGGDGHTTLYPTLVPGISGLALTDNSTNFVHASYNDGITPLIETTLNPYNINMIDKVPLYVIVREGTKLTYIDAREQNVDHIAKNQIKEFYTETFKRKNGGMIISDKGALHLGCTAGAFFFQLNEYTVSALDTTGADTFEYYKHVAGVWTETNSSTIDPLYYDNGTDLVALGNNKFGVHWVYAVVGETSHYGVLYGTAEYANIADAQASSVPSSVPPSVQGLGVLLGRVIVEKGAAELASVETVFETTFSSTLASTHNNLAGLNDGDYVHLTLAEYNELTSVIEW